MFRKTIRILDRALALLEDWTLFAAVAVALVSALANIILRKTTSINLYWSDEVVRKVIFITTYIGASAAIRGRALIRIDAIPQLLPVLRKPMTALNHLGVLAFAGILLWYGTQMTLMVYQDEYARTSTLQIPEWYFYALLPLLGAMMVLRTVVVMVEDLSGKPLHPTEER